MGIEVVDKALFGIGTYNRDFSIDYKGVYCSSNLSLIEVFNIFYNFANNYRGEDISDIAPIPYRNNVINNKHNTYEVLFLAPIPYRNNVIL